MGLDFYIHARITEKKTGRPVSRSDWAEYECEDDDRGFFEICSWHSRLFGDIRSEIIKTAGKYAEKAYTDSELVVPLPQEALREIYAYLVRRSYIADSEQLDDEPQEWRAKGAYESENLLNAQRLHSLLMELDSIKNDNAAGSAKEYISGENDRKLFETDPQAYKWEFRIYNSY